MVTKNARHKKRLVVDFSQTVNSYTNLDAYPLPKINELVNNIARLTIRPPFGGHVLLFNQKTNVLRGCQKMPKCPPFRHYTQ